MAGEKARRGMMGIYLIRNKRNGCCYVGSSVSVANRMKSHLDELANGNHINKRLQEDWKQLGPEHFEFTILELLGNRSLLPERELYWIKKKNAQSLGYNTQTDQYKSRTHISLNTATKKELEELHMGSMDKTIQKLLESFRFSERK